MGWMASQTSTSPAWNCPRSCAVRTRRTRLNFQDLTPVSVGPLEVGASLGSKLLLELQQDAYIFQVLRPACGLFHANQIIQTGKKDPCLTNNILDAVLPDFFETDTGNKGMNVSFQHVLADRLWS